MKHPPDFTGKPAASILSSSDFSEDVNGGSDHGLANVVTGEAFPLEDESSLPTPAKDPPTVEPAGPPPTTIASNSTEDPLLDHDP